MKKWIIAAALTAGVVLLCGLFLQNRAIDVNENTKVVIKYSYSGVDFEQELPSEQAKAVIQIINKKKPRKDSPSCGFSKDVSIRIDDDVFCIACDECGILQLDESDKYIYISDEERKSINDVFKQYGGTFPCV